MRLRLDDIAFGKNVRIDERNLDKLADSIRKRGILQPITVVVDADGSAPECLTGHRRLLAARIAGVEWATCIARPRGSEQARLLEQLAENLDREPMSPIELGHAYADLRKTGMTQQQIAEAFGITQSQVSERLLILQYPEIVQRFVHQKKVGITDALALPLDLAKATDGRTMAAVMRRGGRYLRLWTRQQSAAIEAATGQKVKRRTRFDTLNIDSDLIDDVRDAATIEGVAVVEWLRRAVNERLERQGRRSA